MRTRCAYCFVLDDAPKHYKPALHAEAERLHITVDWHSQEFHSDCWNSVKVLVERAKERSA